MKLVTFVNFNFFYFFPSVVRILRLITKSVTYSFGDKSRSRILTWDWKELKPPKKAGMALEREGTYILWKKLFVKI